MTGNIKYADDNLGIYLNQPEAWQERFEHETPLRAEQILNSLKKAVEEVEANDVNRSCEDMYAYSSDAAYNMILTLNNQLLFTEQQVFTIVSALLKLFEATARNTTTLTSHTRAAASIHLNALIANCLATMLRRYRYVSSMPVVSWLSLYEILHCTHFIDLRLSPVAGRQLRKTHKSAMKSLIASSRRFFSTNASSEIFERCFNHGSAPTNLRFFIDVSLFSIFLPQYSCGDYVLLLLERVMLTNPCHEMVTCFLSVAAQAAKHGDLCADKVMPHAFQWFLQQMPLRIGGKISNAGAKMSATKSSRTVFPSSLYWLIPNGGHSRYIAKIVAYTLNKDSCTLGLLKQFLQTVALAFHPSNAGPWSNTLGDFLRFLCKYVAKRYYSDIHRDNPQLQQYVDEPHHQHTQITIAEAVADVLLPSTLHALYSKQSRMVNCARLALRHLSYICPHRVFPTLLSDIAENLSSAAQSHRTLSSINLLTTIMHSLVHRRLYPNGAQHITALMWATLEHIDSNHIIKANLSLSVCTILFYSVPLLDASDVVPNDESNSDTAADEDMSYEDARHSTLSFSKWALAFIETLVKFLHNIDKFEKTSSLDVSLSYVVYRSARAFFSSLSEKVHREAVDVVTQFLLSHTNLPSIKFYGVLLKASAFGYPQNAIDGALIPLLNKLNSANEKNMHENITLSSMAVTDTTWILYLASQVVGHCGGNCLIALSSRIAMIAEAAMMHPDSRHIQKNGRKLLRSTLKALTQTYPMEYRAFPPSKWNEPHWKHWQSWGRFHDRPDDDDDDDNTQVKVDPQTLEISWHDPSTKELEAAAEIVSRVYARMLQHSNDIEQTLKRLMDFRAAVEGTVSVAGGFEGAFLDRHRVCIKCLPLPRMVLPDTQISLRTLTLRNVISLSTPENESTPEFCTVIISLLQLCLNMVSVSHNRLKAMTITNRDVLRAQQEFASRRKSILRAVQVERMHCLLLSRADLTLQNAPITQDVVNAISILERLCQSPFQTVRVIASDVLIGSLRSRQSLRASVIKRASEVLRASITVDVKDAVSTNSNDNRVLGVAHLLRQKPLWITSSWGLLRIVTLSLCCSGHHQDDLVQANLHGLFLSLLPQLQQLPLTNTATLENFASELVDVGNNKVESFVDNVEDTKADIHWRQELMVTRFLQILLRSDSFNIVSTPIIMYFAHRLIHSDFVPLRRLCLTSLSTILAGSNTNCSDSSNTLLSSNLINTSAPTNDDLRSAPHEFFTNSQGWIIESCAAAMISPHTAISNAIGDVRIHTHASPRTMGDSCRNELIQFLMNNLDALINALEEDHPHLQALLNQGCARDKGTASEIAASGSGRCASRVHWPPTTHAPVKDTMEIEHVEFIASLSQLSSELRDALLNIISKQCTNKSNTTSDGEELSKERQVTIAEIWAGITRCMLLNGFGSSSSSSSSSSPMPSLIITIINDSLDNASPDMVKEWSSALRFVSSDIDVRRLQWLHSALVSAALPDSNTLTHISPSFLYKRMCFVESVLVETAWRGNDFANEIALRLNQKSSVSDTLPCLVTSPYSQVRQAVSRIIVLLLRAQYRVKLGSKANAPCITQEARCPVIEDIIFSLITHLQPLADAEWSSDKANDDDDDDDDDGVAPLETVLSLVIMCVILSDLVYSADIVLRFVPIVCAACHHPRVETSALAKNALACVSWAELQDMHALVSTIDTIFSSSAWNTRYACLEFVQSVIIRHSFSLEKTHLSAIRKLIEKLLRDNRQEVRELASQALTGLVLCSGTFLARDKMIKRFMTACRHELNKNDSTSVCERHAGVLGLSALVRSDPYDVPQWMPRVLAFLSSFVHDPIPIGAGLQKLFSEFRRTHQDAWHVLKHRFTSDQMTRLNEATIAPSYFA